MTFDVKFDLDPMTLNVGFGELYDVSDGEAESLYQKGYGAGKTDGYAEGEEAGYAKGETAGYAKGQAEGYAEGTAAEQTATDGILTRSISGAYRNDRVTSIGGYAFASCEKLKRLILRNTSKVCTLVSTTAFDNTPVKSGTGYICVPGVVTRI